MPPKSKHPPKPKRPPTKTFTLFNVPKLVLKNLGYIALSSVICSGLVLSSCWYISEQNKKTYLQAIQSNTLKDASRLTNESFGISWGFQADDTVMDTLDSGDLFFIKYECSECISLSDMLKCYKLTIPLLEEEYHAVGLGYRDADIGLACYFNQLGKNRLMKYSEVVSLPYIKELMVQKQEEKVNIHTKLVKLLEKDGVFSQLDEERERIQRNLNKNEEVSNSYKKSSIRNSYEKEREEIRLKAVRSVNKVQQELEKQQEQKQQQQQVEKNEPNNKHISNSIKTEQKEELSEENPDKDNNPKNHFMPTSFSKYFEELVESFKEEENTFTFLNRILLEVGILELGEEVTDIRELFTNEKQINVRTQTNNTLRSL